MALVIWRQDSVSLGVDGGGSAAQSLVGGKPGPGESVAASAETKGADASWVWWAYGLIVGAAFGGWGLWG